MQRAPSLRTLATTALLAAVLLAPGALAAYDSAVSASASGCGTSAVWQKTANCTLTLTGTSGRNVIWTENGAYAPCIEDGGTTTNGQQVSLWAQVDGDNSKALNLGQGRSLIRYSTRDTDGGCSQSLSFDARLDNQAPNVRTRDSSEGGAYTHWGNNAPRVNRDLEIRYLLNDKYPGTGADTAAAFSPTYRFDATSGTTSTFDNVDASVGQYVRSTTLNGLEEPTSRRPQFVIDPYGATFALYRLDWTGNALATGQSTTLTKYTWDQATQSLVSAYSITQTLAQSPQQLEPPTPHIIRNEGKTIIMWAMQAEAAGGTDCTATNNDCRIVVYDVEDTGTALSLVDTDVYIGTELVDGRMSPGGITAGNHLQDKGDVVAIQRIDTRLAGDATLATQPTNLENVQGTLDGATADLGNAKIASCDANFQNVSPYRIPTSGQSLGVFQFVNADEPNLVFFGYPISTTAGSNQVRLYVASRTCGAAHLASFGAGAGDWTDREANAPQGMQWAAADFDMDGLTEIVLSAAGWFEYVLLEYQSGTFTRAVGPVDYSNTIYKVPNAWDYDGDGQPELFLIDANKVSGAFTNSALGVDAYRYTQGSGLASAFSTSIPISTWNCTTACSSFDPVLVNDLDRDGNPDILMIRQATSTDKGTAVEIFPHHRTLRINEASLSHLRNYLYVNLQAQDELPAGSSGPNVATVTNQQIRLDTFETAANTFSGVAVADDLHTETPLTAYREQCEGTSQPASQNGLDDANECTASGGLPCTETEKLTIRNFPSGSYAHNHDVVTMDAWASLKADNGAGCLHGAAASTETYTLQVGLEACSTGTKASDCGTGSWTSVSSSAISPCPSLTGVLCNVGSMPISIPINTADEVWYNSRSCSQAVSPTGSSLCTESDPGLGFTLTYPGADGSGKYYHSFRLNAKMIGTSSRSGITLTGVTISENVLQDAFPLVSGLQVTKFQNNYNSVPVNVVARDADFSFDYTLNRAETGAAAQGRLQYATSTLPLKTVAATTSGTGLTRSVSLTVPSDLSTSGNAFLVGEVTADGTGLITAASTGDGFSIRKPQLATIIDSTAPVISWNSDFDAGTNGWQTSKSTVIYSNVRLEDTGGSGFKELRYGTDGTTYPNNLPRLTTGFTISTAGYNQVRFQGLDNAGNQATSLVSYAAIDVADPTLTDVAVPNPATWYNAVPTIQFQAADPHSGIWTIDYKVSATANDPSTAWNNLRDYSSTCAVNPMPRQGPLTSTDSVPITTGLLAQGLNYLSIRVTDCAGHVKVFQDRAQLRWDNRNPVQATIAINNGVSANGNSWFNSRPDLRVDSADNTAGLSAGQYSDISMECIATSSSGPWTECASSLVKTNVAAGSGQDFYARATDGAGNQFVNPSAFRVNLDTSSPSLTVAFTDGAGSTDNLLWHNERTTAKLTFTSSDAQSGVWKVFLAVDGTVNTATDTPYWTATLSGSNPASAPTTAAIPDYALTSMTDGTHTVQVVAMNAAGGTTTSSITVKLDTTAPILSGYIPGLSSYPGIANGIQLQVTTSDPHAGNDNSFDQFRYYFDHSANPAQVIATTDSGTAQTGTHSATITSGSGASQVDHRDDFLYYRYETRDLAHTPNTQTGSYQAIELGTHVNAGDTYTKAVLQYKGRTDAATNQAYTTNVAQALCDAPLNIDSLATTTCVLDDAGTAATREWVELRMPIVDYADATKTITGATIQMFRGQGELQARNYVPDLVLQCSTNSATWVNCPTQPLDPGTVAIAAGATTTSSAVVTIADFVLDEKVSGEFVTHWRLYVTVPELITLTGTDPTPAQTLRTGNAFRAYPYVTQIVMDDLVRPGFTSAGKAYFNRVPNTGGTFASFFRAEQDIGGFPATVSLGAMDGSGRSVTGKYVPFSITTPETILENGTIYIGVEMTDAGGQTAYAGDGFSAKKATVMINEKLRLSAVLERVTNGNLGLGDGDIVFTGVAPTAVSLASSDYLRLDIIGSASSIVLDFGPYVTLNGANPVGLSEEKRIPIDGGNLQFHLLQASGAGPYTNLGSQTILATSVVGIGNAVKTTDANGVVTFNAQSPNTFTGTYWLQPILVNANANLLGNAARPDGSYSMPGQWTWTTAV